MMSYSDAVDVVKQIINDCGRGVAWSDYPLHRYDISKEAKKLAIDVLDSDIVIPDPDSGNKVIKIADAFKNSLKKEIGGAIHRDYIYRVLAFALDDDENGNHISVALLRVAKQYRMQVLGMAY